jgi:hypothetical protein
MSQHREATGWPIITLSQGAVVVADDVVVARPGRGLLLARAITRSL